jgi:hypothetical protein
MNSVKPTILVPLEFTITVHTMAYTQHISRTFYIALHDCDVFDLEIVTLLGIDGNN